MLGEESIVLWSFSYCETSEAKRNKGHESEYKNARELRASGIQVERQEIRSRNVDLEPVRLLRRS